MKRLILGFIFVFLIGGGAFILRNRILRSKQGAALQIVSDPKATIFLEGKHLGQTPFEDKTLKPGEYLLKLVPESETLKPWEQKIKLNPGVLTVVKHKFAENEDSESGEVLTLEPLTNKKLISLAVISLPDGALVKVDGTTRGFAPLSLEDITEGEHSISLSLPGYFEMEIKARTILGHKLIIEAKLSKEEVKVEKATLSAEKKESEIQPPYIEVKKTPTGWLRVRMGPTIAATEAAKIKPGEKYPLLDKEKGWYKIRYDKNKEGWISAKYAVKHE